jgi:caa(3)-type oxidase subunit IV
MNNPPEVTQDPKEYEEYAHGVQKHVRGYLMVGATLLAFTMITVALSYVDFGALLSSLFHTNLSVTQGRKANIAVAVLVATFKAGLVAAIFMHLAAEKRLIYRILVFTGFFVLGLFWLILLAWYDYPVIHHLNVP